MLFNLSLITVQAYECCCLRIALKFGGQRNMVDFTNRKGAHGDAHTIVNKLWGQNSITDDDRRALMDRLLLALEKRVEEEVNDEKFQECLRAPDLYAKHPHIAKMLVIEYEHYRRAKDRAELSADNRCEPPLTDQDLCIEHIRPKEPPGSRNSSVWMKPTFWSNEAVGQLLHSLGTATYPKFF